jgi:hypothetical protein
MDGSSRAPATRPLALGAVLALGGCDAPGDGEAPRTAELARTGTAAELARTATAAELARTATAAELARTATAAAQRTPAPAATTASAAASTPVAPPDRPRRYAAPRGAPAWVREGWGATGDAVWAVGRAAGIRNPALARSVADNRARAALARALERSPRPEVVARLEGVEIIERWTDPRTGTIFARARLRRSPDDVAP